VSRLRLRLNRCCGRAFSFLILWSYGYEIFRDKKDNCIKIVLQS
jgi:hypothetical protein